MGKPRSCRPDRCRRHRCLASLGGNQDHTSSEFHLKSPINGVVIARTTAASIGAEAQPGSGTLFIVADLSKVWVLADLPEREMQGVHPGLAVEVEAQAYPGIRFPGTLEYVSELLDQSTRTAKLRCLIPNGQLRLKPEMFVDVTLHRPQVDLFIAVEHGASDFVTRLRGLLRTGASAPCSPERPA